MKKLVVIGGSGFADKLSGTARDILTPHGNVSVLISKVGDVEVYAVKRHGSGHTTPPHMVNYWANVALAAKVEAQGILASCAVGVIGCPHDWRSPSDLVRLAMLRFLQGKPVFSSLYNPGDLILGGDVLALNISLDGKPVTFNQTFPNGPKHADCSNVFDQNLNDRLKAAAKSCRIPLRYGAVLGYTYGPRYETPAEVAALRILGADLVGMTAANEAVLAAEQSGFENDRSTPYAIVAIATNWAAGLGGKLDHTKVIQMMERRSDDVSTLLIATIQRM